MPKTLYLMRHAKSDWNTAGQKDFERPLNSRGLRDAPRMGMHLAKKPINPQLIVSSPAERAKTTAIYVAEQLKYDTENILLDENIYEASVRSLLNVINQFEDKFISILVFGHNPSFSYLAEYLTKKEIGNIPTAGIVCIHFEVESWAMISEGTGNLAWFDYPKKLD